MNIITGGVVILISILNGIYGAPPAVGASGFQTNEVRVSAFNIQVLGEAKMEDPEVVAILVKVMY